MAQVSYGTITITDTTDIERIYMVYAGSESNITPPDVNDFALWKTDVTQTSGTYIWQRAVVKKSGIEITAQNFQQFYGEPACITGEGGRSIKSITTYCCNYGIGTPDEDYSGWSINTPEYDSSKPNYWVKTVIIYVDDSEENFELSGDIVTFEDGEHKYLTSLITTLDPIQDLHGYDHPWVGGAGANKWDEEWEVGGIDTTTGQNITSNNILRSKNFIPVTGGETYRVVIGGSTSLWIAVLTYDEGKNFIANAGGKVGGSTFTVDSSVAYIRFYVTSNYGTTYKNDIAINYPSTVTTYSPYENICPISGWDSAEASVVEKNLWGGEKLADDILSIVPNSTKDTTAHTVTFISSDVSNKMIVDKVFKANTQYTFIFKEVDGSNAINFVIVYTDGSYHYFPRGGSGIITSTAGKTVKSLRGVWASGTTILDYDRSGIFEGVVTEDQYEPYQGTTHTATFEETVYGGTVDLVSGVLTIDRVYKVLDGSDDEGWSVGASGTHYRGYTYALSDIKPHSSNTQPTSAICDKIETGTWNSAFGGTLVLGQTGKAIGFGLDSLGITKTADLDAWLANNPITIVYPLAEPRTIQLDPQTITTLVGQNNVWSDAGEVTVSGFTIVDKDIQIYLDNALTDAIAQSVEANTNASEALNKANEAESIATHANEDSQGAMSQAAAAQYATEALAAKVKHYWWDSTGAHIASGINGADVTEGTASTYGFNSLVGLTSMTFGYNSYKAVELDGSIPALKFYKPLKTAQGDLTATLDSNGLILSKGGVKAGTPNQSGFIYLSTEPYGSYSVNGSSGISDWKEIIGTKFGVRTDGTLYANNAVISGQITLGTGSKIGTTDVSTVVENASAGAQTSKYVTKNSNTDITVHPEVETNTTAIQLNSNGLDIVKNGISIAQYGSTARVGIDESSRFLMSTDSLQAYDKDNSEYFEVTKDSLSWGTNIAATTSEVNTLNNYVRTYLWVDEEGVHVSKTTEDEESDEFRDLLITDEAINIRINGVPVAAFSDDITLGSDKDNAKILINNTGIDFINEGSQLKVGYDDSRELYGTISQNYFVYGNGASIKFDSSASSKSRGKFITEIRDNGHWSMKRY